MIILNQEDKGVLYAAGGRVTCASFEKGDVTATNGFIIAQKPIDYDGKRVLIPAFELLDAFKGKKGSLAINEDTGEGSIRDANIKFTLSDDAFPNTRDILNGVPEGTVKVCIGQAMLKTLLNVMRNSEYVTLEIAAPTAPIKYRTSDGISGVFMPMS